MAIYCRCRVHVATRLRWAVNSNAIHQKTPAFDLIHNERRMIKACTSLTGRVIEATVQWTNLQQLIDYTPITAPVFASHPSPLLHRTMELVAHDIALYPRESFGALESADLGGHRGREYYLKITPLHYRCALICQQRIGMGKPPWVVMNGGHEAGFLAGLQDSWRVPNARKRTRSGS